MFVFIPPPRQFVVFCRVILTMVTQWMPDLSIARPFCHSEPVGIPVNHLPDTAVLAILLVYRPDYVAFAPELTTVTAPVLVIPHRAYCI